MAFVTTGLTKNAQGQAGVTPHYHFSYDSSFAAPGGPEPARTNAVIAACENDYTLMSGWFGGGIDVTGMNVQVTTQSNNTCAPGNTPSQGGACWGGSQSSSTIQLIAQGPSYSTNPAYLRYLLISEVTELFMMAQNTGWFQGGDEGSKGEGLSRFLGLQFLLTNGLGSVPFPGFGVTPYWLNGPRQDFVNNDPDDNRPDQTTGCTTLFLYYLHDQLGFAINAIIAAGSSNLAGVYQKLKGQPDGWTPFINLVNSHYPPGFNYTPAGDTVFPVAELSAFWAPNQITCGYSEPTQLFIDRPALAQVNIRLTSDDPTLVSVPTAVTIPVGSLSTSFSVTAAALPIPFPPKFVNIHATYAGKTLTLSAEVVPPTVASVTLSPATVVCGDSSTGTVTLNRPSLLGPVVVDLICGAPGFASVPAQVTVPQNSLSQTFAITTPDIAIPFRTAHAEIYATYSGSAASAWLTVKSRVIAGILASLTLFPSTVTGGNTSRGTVTLEEAVPTDTLVGLAAVEPGLGPLPLPGHDSSIAHVPASITIPAGDTSMVFTIRTTRLLPGTTRKATIIAGAVGTKYAALSVTS